MASLDDLLHAAVQGVGGVERPGQVEMAHAVEDAVAKDEHLLVQAGTGTGKSLAYLIPAVMHAQKTGKPAVVATATLALQAQIVDRDMPRLAESIAPLLGKRPTYGLVKGRRNYLCAHKLEGGFPDDEEGLFEVGVVDRAASRLGQEVVRLREWADTTESGDRDELGVHALDGAEVGDRRLVGCWTRVLAGGGRQGAEGDEEGGGGDHGKDPAGLLDGVHGVLLVLRGGLC